MTQQRYAKNKIKSCKIPQILDKCELRKDLTFWGSSREREKSLFFGVFRAILSKLNLCNTLGEVQQSECQRNCGHAGTKPTAACRQSKEKGHFLLLWWFLLDLETVSNTLSKKSQCSPKVYNQRKYFIRPHRRPFQLGIFMNGTLINFVGHCEELFVPARDPCQPLAG